MVRTDVRQYLVWIMIAVAFAATAACAPKPERRDAAEFVDDAVLTARVKAALVKAEGLKGATEIEVTSYRGEVQLSGFVESTDMIERAVATARKVEGVRAVQNDLRVRPRR